MCAAAIFYAPRATFYFIPVFHLKNYPQREFALPSPMANNQSFQQLLQIYVVLVEQRRINFIHAILHLC